jgi:AsmA protein
MNWILRVFLGLVVLILLGIGALFLIPAERIARIAEDQFEAATGRALTISGDVRPSIYPFLGVKTGAVSVANADWAGDTPLFQAQGLDVGVALMPLISGDIQITALELDRPNINLVMGADGTGNWVMGTGETAPDDAGETPGGLPNFSLTKGLISKGNLRFEDRKTGTIHAIADLDLEVALPDPTGDLNFTLGAGLNGQSAKIIGKIAPFNALLENGVLEVVAEATLGGNTAAFDGQVDLAAVSAGGQMALDAGDLPGLFAALGQAAPDLPKAATSPLRLGGQVSYADNTAFLRGASAQIGPNTLALDADANLSGDLPFVTARITAGLLDLSAFSGGPSSGGGSGWPKDKIDASALSALNADLRLTADAIDLGDMQLGAVDMRSRLDNARLVTDIASLAMYQGNINGQVVLNNRAGLSVGGDLRAANIQLQPLLIEMADTDQLQGATDLNVKFLASGASVHDWMQTLSGDGALTVGQGKILDIDLAGMLKNFDTSYRGSGQDTLFDGISASFTMAKGVLTNSDLRFDSKRLIADGKGTVNLGAQALNYQITPSAFPGDDRIDGIKIPLLISGPWSNLKIQLDLESLAEQRLAIERDKIKAQAEAALEAQKQKLKEQADAAIEAQKQKLQDKINDAVGLPSTQNTQGTSIEDAAKDALEKELKKGLGGLFGN